MVMYMSFFIKALKHMEISVVGPLTNLNPLFVLFAGLIFMFLGNLNIILFAIGIFIFIIPYFYFYAKAVDEACMIQKVLVKNLTEGDWLYKNIKVGKNKINATWAGLTKKEIGLIKKHKEFVYIRQGIPFTPVFLFSFLVFIYFLRNPFW